MPKPTLTQTHKQNEQQNKMAFQWAFLLPRYWGIWLVIACFLPLVLLPLRHQFWCGRQFGKLTWHLAKKRRRDTLTNLNLAYPDKSKSDKQHLAKEVFINQGVGIFESLCAWFRPNVFYKSFTAKGLQHLVHAQNANKAIILLGMHTTTLDLSGRLCTQFFAMDCLYRPQNNPLLEWFVYNARRRIFEAQISHKDMRTLAKRLKAGKVLWYSPDQDFGLSAGVMAPFFGMPAATITAWRRIARLGDKQNPPAVLLFSVFRTSSAAIAKGGRAHYELTFSPMVGLPSNDELADATFVNQLLAEHINRYPSQWMWFHRRFKTQPSGVDYYKVSDNE